MKNKCNCGKAGGYHDVACSIHKGFVPEDGAGNRCCCGKYSDVEAEGFISNKIQHMPINTGSFCGPVDHHIISTLHNRIKELVAFIGQQLIENTALHDKIKELEEDSAAMAAFVREHHPRLALVCRNLRYTHTEHARQWYQHLENMEIK